MEKVKFVVLTLLLFMFINSVLGQKNFYLQIDSQELYEKIIRENIHEFNSLGFNPSENRIIGTNTRFFEWNENDFFRDFDLLKGHTTNDSLVLYKLMFTAESNKPIKVGEYTALLMNTELLKDLIKKITSILQNKCDTTKHIYSISEEWRIKNGKIDYDNDFRIYVPQKCDDTWKCALYTYRHGNSYHNNVDKRDYLAFFKNDRINAEEWIYIKNKNSVEHNGSKFYILQQNVCESKKGILAKILFLCRMSDRYKVGLLSD